jgi:site-specific DNA recombinase
MSTAKKLRCAVYTRKSTEEGLDQEFNSLDAQREACVAFIASQVGLGWKLVSDHYDDGGISGGTMERPALQRLLQDIRDRKIDVVVVYKIDRLTRSLMDFSRIVETFDGHDVSFVSVTQQFNTTTSMGRLTLNVLSPSRSSSVRSPQSASATRSLRRRRRACGWAAWCHWDTGSRTVIW